MMYKILMEMIIPGLGKVIPKFKKIEVIQIAQLKFIEAKEERIIQLLRETFEEVVNIGGMNNMDLFQVLNSNGLLGLFQRVVKQGIPFSNYDVALIIARYEKKHLSSQSIVDLAEAFSEKVITQVINDSSILEFLGKKYSSLSSVCEMVDISSNQFFSNLVSDHRKFSLEYYTHFSKRANSYNSETRSYIRVFYGDENSIVDWSGDQQFDISINGFKSDKIDVAFCTTATDYRFYDNDKEYFLNEIRKDKNGNVQLKFGGKSLGKLDGESERIWLR